MTSAEVTEAYAFERIEPDPADVSVRLLAQLLALFSNVYRDAKKHPEPFKPSDFLPRPVDAPQELTAAPNLRAKIDGVMARLGGKRV